MKKIKIISDGACDLPETYVQEHKISIIPFYIMDESGVSRLVDVNALYEDMLQNPNKMFKTACPSPETYYQIFKEYVDKDIPVICVCISKELSGSHNSACVAKNMIAEEKPDAKVAIIDSMHNSASQGLVVKNIQIMRDQNLGFEEICTKIEENRTTGKIAFFVDNLKYLENGGRIGKLKGLVSKLLNLKPHIVMENGNIRSGGIAMGLKKSIVKVIDTILNSIKNIGDKITNYHFTVGYGANKEMGETLMSAFKERLSVAQQEELSFHQIGSTSAVHTGPHTYGIAMIKKII